MKVSTSEKHSNVVPFGPVSHSNSTESFDTAPEQEESVSIAPNILGILGDVQERQTNSKGIKAERLQDISGDSDHLSIMSTKPFPDATHRQLSKVRNMTNAKHNDNIQIVKHSTEICTLNCNIPHFFGGCYVFSFVFNGKISCLRCSLLLLAGVNIIPGNQGPGLR